MRRRDPVDATRAAGVPTRSMNVTIAIAPEHPSEAWWSAARGAKGAPRELKRMIAGKVTAIEVSRERAREVRSWCATLPGWDADRAPLSFVGLVGRPPSPRRSAGGKRIVVWVSADEEAALDALRKKRGQKTLQDVLRTSALADAKREAARTSDGATPPTEGTAEPVAVEALAVDDHVYTDTAHRPPRGRPEKVLAIRREQELWCVELASGAPLWLAAGAEIWRRQRRPRT